MNLGKKQIHFIIKDTHMIIMDDDCKLVQPLWRVIQWFLRKLGINLPQDSVKPVLRIYPKDTPSYNNNNNNKIPQNVNDTKVQKPSPIPYAFTKHC